jgi:hypothetical protein
MSVRPRPKGGKTLPGAYYFCHMEEKATVLVDPLSKAGSRRCFVVMPFTVKDVDKQKYLEGHWDEVYAGLIAPAVRDAGLTCERDDEDHGSRLIAESILLKIEEADLVICDLSSHNPNVFLELGWTIRTDKPYVLIKDDLTTYTFDLGQHHTFDYSHMLQPTVLMKEINDLAKVIRRTIDDPDRRYSLVKRLSLSLSTIRATNEGDLQVKLLSEIRQFIESLDIRRRGTSEPRSVFVWPELLRRATRALCAGKDALLDAGEPTESFKVLGILKSVIATLGGPENRDMQLSVVGPNRQFIYHDWGDLIGTPAGYAGDDGHDMYDDVTATPFGAVAWIDNSSNARTSMGLGMTARFNIALFALVGPRHTRVVVETHHEVDIG